MLKSLLPRLAFFPRVTLLIALVTVVPAIADGLKPSQEFLEYLAEYGDENGEVIDPLELDEILNMKEDSANEQKHSELNHSTEKSYIRNTEMNIGQNSSVKKSAQSLPSKEAKQ